MGQLSPSSLTLRRNAKISAEEFTELRQFIYDKIGISIPERRKYLLENRLGSRLRALNLKSFKEYTNYLKKGTDRLKEMVRLCEKITTNETFLYRDTKQLAVFQDHILKEVLKKQAETGKKELHIWSAGCSSGEEPYTLAIMLHEVLGMSIIGWKIRITANDLSPAMLVKAKKGIYGEYAIRTTPPEILKKYFTQTDQGYEVIPRVKKLVSFGPINLSDVRACRRIPSSNIVFCRNVIIYFDDKMKGQVVNAFYDNLNPGGYLFLGHSESIHKLGTQFVTTIKPGGMAYAKPAAE